MEFKSQICTTREQSERLVAMGLKPETADMVHSTIVVLDNLVDLISEHPWTARQEVTDNWYPAWSLHRLLELMGVREQMVLLPDAYNDTIADIEISIKTGHISKDYLTNNESKD